MDHDTCKKPSPRCASTRPRLVLALAAALTLWPAAARATSSDDIEDGAQSFFDPAIIERPDEAPFFRSGHIFYNQSEQDGAPPFADIETINQGEWSRYLGGKVPDKSLGYLLYAMKVPELDKLVFTFEGKSPTLGKDAAAVKAGLDAIGDRGKVLRALYYLGFAKRCEPIALRALAEDGWDAEKLAAQRARDNETVTRLLGGSEGLMAAARDDAFLKERYHFQRLRLLFYGGRHAEAQRYYGANVGEVTSASSVRYRFLSTAAGAYYRDKQYGTANYLYSLVFGGYGPLKRSAFRSFKPVEDRDWRASLALTRSDRERAVLWQLLGITADGPAAIERIYALSPASDLLPLLLVREVNKAEEDWTLNDERRRDTIGSGAAAAGPDAEVVGRKRLALVRRLAEAKKVQKPHLWQLALAHLLALAGDYAGSETALAQAEAAMPKTPSLLAQARRTRLFARIRAQSSIDKAREPYLAAELAWLKDHPTDVRSRVLLFFALERLSQVYRKGGDPLRALLLVDVRDSDFYQDNQRLDALLAFQARPGKSAFDDFLVRNHGYSRAQMIRIKALNDLYAGRFQGAVDLFAQAGPLPNEAPLMADPFIIHIVDCHDCDHAAKKTTQYRLATFAQRLLALSKQAEGRGQAAAEASFLLANGLYNMSYYGNARDVYDTAHGNFRNDTPFTNRMDLAERAYRRAADLSSDREFKARALFMAAKTEQNRFFNAQREAQSAQPGAAAPQQTRTYFKMLKDGFSDTRYYQELIRECGTFRGYAGK